MNNMNTDNNAGMFSLVSIIVPAYNEEKNIEGCVNRLLNQSYKNIEIIIIDDGSTDSTFSLCKLLTKKDSRVKVFTQPNSGVSVARNHGLDVSQGEYVMFVDADDELLPDAVECMFNSIINNPVDIVQGCMDGELSANIQYSGGNFIIESKQLLGSILDYSHTSKDNLEKRFIRSTHGSCAKLFRKSFLQFYLLKFDTDLVLGEDMMFTLKTYVKSEKICLLDKLVYKIVENPNSSTRRFNRKMSEGALAFIEELNIYLTKESLLLDLDVERRFICFLTLFAGIKTGIINDIKLLHFFDNISEIRSLCNNRIVQTTLVEFLELSKDYKNRYGFKLFFLAFLLHNRMFFLFTFVLKLAFYLRIIKCYFKRSNIC